MSTSNNIRHGDPIADIRQSELPGGQQQAYPTRQFQEFLDDLADVDDLASTLEAEPVRVDSLSIALVAKLQKQVGSGNFLTSDETGFTVDSGRLSCDMDEA